MAQIEVKILIFFQVVLSGTCTKERAARAARVFWLIQPMILLFLTALTAVNAGSTCASCLATKGRQTVSGGIILEIMRSIWTHKLRNAVFFNHWATTSSVKWRVAYQQVLIQRPTTASLWTVPCVSSWLYASVAGKDVESPVWKISSLVDSFLWCVALALPCFSRGLINFQEYCILKIV